ncbi:GNAT family N-acetyltransferase [Myroides ceti]|uniref:GNAT family N-acetyltransferase n=1 Tax=Paenimyroides ceti TaxID=395087 RepID=A0ABT8D0W5_9FLAO|nr:GNAT family N-acetyltransferase [Paenimyroides ceti]MDN3706930.1 GNAT family N-acetyltransferase [Paenimyroides ceti]MDN3709075.1 GNAT family N-acetyltransferase [Paenimyroides ceti]
MDEQRKYMIQIIENQIPVETYRMLRSASGLSEKTTEAAERGLKNSLYSILIEQEDLPIGMGRIIGDGGCFCQVVDICVLPEHQGNGIGKVIMEHIITYIEKLPESCYVSLIADGDAYRLYEKFGFKDTLPRSRGMGLKV